ncbi:MAG: DUF3147 family protein [Terracidiphilus sp.]
MHVEIGELLARFLIGGIIVSFFAVLAEMFRPKSFAGLFGAAPSIALATIGITIASHGKTYAATEARSMICGAIAFLLYASCVSCMLIRWKPRALTATITLMPVWFAASFAFWLIVR